MLSVADDNEMCSFYKAFVDICFLGGLSKLGSLSFKAWTFNHLLDSQAMWVLVLCSCTTL